MPSQDGSTAWSPYKETGKHLISGAFAGAISRSSVSPLERLKILLQLQPSQAENAKYSGIFRSLQLIHKEEGVRGFYKGNGTNVVRIMPYMAVQFAAYEEFKKVFYVTSGPESAFRRLLAGALAGICSVSVTYPLDLVRTRLSVQIESKNPKYRSIAHCFRTILREEGGFFSGCLYRGIGPTLAGIAPYVGINFAVYETLKGYAIVTYVPASFSAVHGPSSSVADAYLPAYVKLACGCLSGGSAQCLTYPLDVLRRRMQMKGFSHHFAYKNTFHAIRVIIKTEGLRGLYKGFWPNLVKVAPAMGMNFATYEFVKARLNGVPIGLRWRSDG